MGVVVPLSWRRRRSLGAFPLPKVDAVVQAAKVADEVRLRAAWLDGASSVEDAHIPTTDEDFSEKRQVQLRQGYEAGIFSEPVPVAQSLLEGDVDVGHVEEDVDAAGDNVWKVCGEGGIV